MGSEILYAVNIVGPIFLIISLGYLLRAVNFFDEAFVKKLNKLVYYVVLPVYLFISIGQSDFSEALTGEVFITAVFGGLFVLGIVIFFSKFLTNGIEERGAFVQVSFRSNIAYVGLALIENALGQEGTVIAAPIMAVVLTMYNFIILTLLTWWAKGNRKASLAKQFLVVIKNPFIISIALGTAASLIGLQLPLLAERTGGLLSRLSLPLALLGVGGSLKLGISDHNFKAMGAVVFFKNFFYPAVTVAVSLLLGLDKTAVIVLFIMTSCPSSIASIVVAEGLGYDTKLTASSIVLTTLVSIFAIGTGLILLNVLL